jgi:Na+/pantothenate symporter
MELSMSDSKKELEKSVICVLLFSTLAVFILPFDPSTTLIGKFFFCFGGGMGGLFWGLWAVFALSYAYGAVDGHYEKPPFGVHIFFLWGAYSISVVMLYVVIDSFSAGTFCFVVVSLCILIKWHLFFIQKVKEQNNS